MTEEKKFDDGGPAYPTTVEYSYVDKGPGDYKTGQHTYMGMSLRDHFAGLAMHAAIRRWGGIGDMGNEAGTYSITAEQAYSMADAMIAERNKRGER